MENYFYDILQKLEDEFNEIDIENPILIAEKAIVLTHNSLKELKLFILNRGFKSIEEEIYFFKKLKPNILSKLIYYNSIYKIETKKPSGGKAIKKYINNELNKLKNYFDNNLEFYKYYRTNSNFLDHKYFVRGKHDIKLSLDTYYFISDQTFSTSHDYKVAKIIANDQIQVYLEAQINYSKEEKPIDTMHLNWTGNKTALIELIYALHSQGVIDKGNVDIKVIAKIFESAFNVDLGDFYHAFMEIKSRKINRTKFPRQFA